MPLSTKRSYHICIRYNLTLTRSPSLCIGFSLAEFPSPSSMNHYLLQINQWMNLSTSQTLHFLHVSDISTYLVTPTPAYLVNSGAQSRPELLSTPWLILLSYIEVTAGYQLKINELYIMHILHLDLKLMLIQFKSLSKCSDIDDFVIN